MNFGDSQKKLYIIGVNECVPTQVTAFPVEFLIREDVSFLVSNGQYSNENATDYQAG